MSLAAIPMIWALARYTRLTSIVSTSLFAILTLALAPLHSGIAVGNVSIPTIALCCLAIWAADAHREISAGILLGMATCLKPQLGGCFIFYYMLRKKWRVLLVTGALGAAVFAVGVFRLEMSGVNWLADFLRNARGFAVDNPTVNFTDANPTRFTLVNLQVLFYTLTKSVTKTQLAATAVGITLFGTWIWLGIRLPSRTSDLLLLSSLGVISLLPSYHRNYDATLLIIPLCWVLSVRQPELKNVRCLALLLMLPFSIPGGAMLQQLQDQGRIPGPVVDGWWWNTIVMPHEIWALLFLSFLLLYALAVTPVMEHGSA